MDAALAWSSAFFARNFMDVIQALIFSLVTVMLFFRTDARPRQLAKFALSFLVSFNTATIISTLVYQAVCANAELTGTLWDFLLATACLLVPMLPMIYLYKRVIGSQASVAAFIYALFFNANCVAMIVSDTPLSRTLLTVGMTVLLVWLFAKELRYIADEKSILRTDRRFTGTSLAFMLLLGAEAELPRITFNGGLPTEGNQFAYAVSILGVLLVAMFVIFMKFNFFAIMKYENFIREHDEDQVTGAASLSRFLEVAPGAINRSRERGVEVAIFYTDLANFRDVNIAHGYDVGTDILREIYRILTEQFPTSVIARISGTHFAGEVPLSKAQAGFERVAQRCEALSIDETLRLRIGIYPLSYLGDDEDSRVVPEEMMHLVDLAATAMRFLAPASQEHVRFYDDELERNERIRLHVLASLDKAIEKDWLRIYYQPIVEVPTRKVAEYEALSRWVDPEFGFLTPDQFVVPLEAARMTCKMDLNILRLFGRDVKRLRKENRAVFPISFNISRTDLESGIDLFGAIEEAMRQADLPRELVHVEITESALNGSSTAMAEAIRRFHELGLEVWMDDFGSGYSSLNVLKDYDFDVIKIDMQFMSTFDERSRSIVRSVCEMARSLGIRTVAEGVETEEQFAFLERIGCTYAQGYLFSKPLPADEVLKKMESYR